MNNLHLNRLKILLVEDEDIIREHIASSLGFLVQEIETSSNGKQALEILQNFSPHIIITDLEMPIMNGIDFIKSIRKTDKDTIIIVLTAYSTKEYLLPLVEMHIEHFIIKPISLEKMISVLHDCSKLIKSQEYCIPILPFGYFYNWSQKILLFKGNTIPLSRKEILFFELLLKNTNRIVSYNEIEKAVWIEGIMSTGALRSLVRNMRRKFPINLIDNLSGVGYKLILKD